MQPCASAAKLLGGRPILLRGMETMSGVGLPPPQIINGNVPVWRQNVQVSLIEARLRPKKAERGLDQGSRSWPHDHALWHLTSADQTPKRNQQLARQGDNHHLAGRFATIHGPRSVPLGQSTVLLVQ